MEQFFILELEGDFESGFRVRLESKPQTPDGAAKQIKGRLPANPTLLDYYRQWQRSYRELEIFLGLESESVFRSLNHSNPDQKTNASQRSDAFAACQKTAKLVEKNLNTWLDEGKEFSKIRDELNRADQNFRIWLQIDNVWLRRLPWHKWTVLASAEAEIGICVCEYQSKSVPHFPKRKVRILGILGYASDLESSEKDKDVIDKVAKNTGSEVKWWDPKQKPQELNRLLRQEQWDILFFSGHSASNDEGTEFAIELTKDRQLEIPDFSFALKEATLKGLRLAIFNSCDGVGLAHQIAAEQSIVLPYSIFMREKLPDPISPKFLKVFFEEFTEGKSLCEAVRYAQKILQEDCEKDYPCASWLPVVCPNPQREPPTWKELRYGNRKPIRKTSRSRLIVASLLIAIALSWFKQLGILQPLELSSYDRLMSLRPVEEPDRRIAIVEITPEDIEYQDRHNMGRKKTSSVSDLALLQLLDKLTLARPRVIGLDLYREEAAAADLGERLEKTSNLIGACGEHNQEVLAPPPEIPRKIDRVGFVDIWPDSDDVIRRQVYEIQPQPNAVCYPHYSFSIILAAHYLNKEGDKYRLSHTKNDNKDLQIANIVFKNLTFDAGGYQLPSGSVGRGKQIFLNYRSYRDSRTQRNAVSDLRVSLSEVLEGRVPPDYFEDKIVLIGNTIDAFTFRDYHLTPYGSIAGVEIHAHATSQIVSAVLDDRPLIGYWPTSGTQIWLWIWSFVGGLLAWRLRSPKHLGAAIILANIILWSCCYLFLLKGTWVVLVSPTLGLLVTATIIAMSNRIRIQKKA